MVELAVSDRDRQTLQRWVRRRTSAQALALRARIVLACAEGEANYRVAERLGVTAQTVGRWRGRYIERGCDGLLDEPRPGAPRTLTDEKIERIIVKTLEGAPKNATHWSTRDMAKAAGISQSSVSRIWRAFALQPHRQETFKISTDPLFVEKVRDVVGLDLDPPERALVLCADEKSQIQALDRTQPTLPMLPGTPQRATHDDKRHGTTSLFAALAMGTGLVSQQLHRRHRAVAFKKFLDHLDREVPNDLDVHVILDNYATHKTPAIKKSPASSFTPSPPAPVWLNLVERWFAEITNRLIRRSTHRSENELEDAIRSWIAARNDDPKPFAWVKSAEDIFESPARYLQRIPDSGTLVVRMDVGGWSSRAFETAGVRWGAWSRHRA